MAWAVAFSVIFGIGAVIPAVWSIVGLIRGNTRFWPAVVGVGWAVVLMVITFIGIGTKWGDCDSDSATSDSIACVDKKGNASKCVPDIWAHECHRSSRGFGPTCGDTPSACPSTKGAGLCPAGHTPVYPFCEPIERDAAVKQPAATWSDLSFLAAGLWLLWFFQFFKGPGFAGSPTSGGFSGSINLSIRDNPMVEIGWLSIAYCLIVIFMGPPSMWYHASIRDLGGWFDTMSVVFLLAFNAAYVFHALVLGMWNKARGSLRTVTVLAIWGGLCLLFGVISAFCSNQRTIAYVVTGGSWLVLEIIYVCVGRWADGVVFRRTWWLFIVNLVVFGGTMFLWSEFNPDLGRMLGIITYADCQDREGFPGHAVFHILASFGTITTFLSFASEKNVVVEDQERRQKK